MKVTTNYLQTQTVAIDRLRNAVTSSAKTQFVLPKAHDLPNVGFRESRR